MSLNLGPTESPSQSPLPPCMQRDHTLQHDHLACIQATKNCCAIRNHLNEEEKWGMPTGAGNAYGQGRTRVERKDQENSVATS